MHELDSKSEEITWTAPLGEKMMENMKILVTECGSQNESQYVSKG